MGHPISERHVYIGRNHIPTFDVIGHNAHDVENFFVILIKEETSLRRTKVRQDVDKFLLRTTFQ